ncbi:MULTISPECIES: phosphoribosylformylglycinamidine synthase [unclassified Fusibacter]|uniref:phosphoribosylformylglycinamidine synthase n=1 Tax=unclassified Fusibacter TaxID=2624464 RepID=UPI0010116E62|nr:MULTISPECIES: phosphoribosylformylglycinamidine synthase [unclassified Fusibacter]MCK8059614.1 phosphoribosylformylglycinamidine synthase [Fusibacter sp. A2]NPE21415.1 phosphoribosylformylglycinamidine synthase [Fusibacter sp. A1]RXV61828.1 phosphoribosylformylglycinamidine synthase [Fusibacter sp. A1]
MIARVYVEKQAGFDVEADHLVKSLKEGLGLDGLKKMRVINVYDVEGIDEALMREATLNILSETNVDTVYDESFDYKNADFYFGVEYLPGQFDQRADSAAECIQILSGSVRPAVRSFKLYMLDGQFDEDTKKAIVNYMINPVDSREAILEIPKSIVMDFEVPHKVESIDGFTTFTLGEMKQFSYTMGFAMTLDDLMHIQEYYINTEKRNPTITELKAIDTYWSDHCRHTTFMTAIDEIAFDEDPSLLPVKEAYDRYLEVRTAVYGQTDRPVTLMDLAVIAMKDAKRTGDLDNLDESEEINACSIEIPVNTSEGTEEWLLMYKNETHNHPTEIEPFGGAATCLGGAIRDPLSGRAYVYQAMRVTGAADPRTPLSETLAGKLPQKKITKEAARGYSSYGNQIGLATGQVAEVYHPNYVAKRMEVGAVIAACPKDFVRRETPMPGDIVILVGGRTGRDGCGGATGSSKEHTEDSILACGAEVQKGNPPTERKIQRLFRNKELTRLIKRCNDFGAGGVSVAIGEIADSIDIHLDRVPKKYDGLDGTELAISESQERMAVVVEKEDVDKFLHLSAKENVEAVVVADITDSGRLRMFWKDQTIFDVKREFLDTNGVRQTQAVEVKAYDALETFFKPSMTDDESVVWQLKAKLSSLNITSQKGLQEMFDSTIGAGTVLMPLGGKHQLTPVDGMVAKIPVLGKETTTCSAMTYGFHPDLASWSPFHGAYYAVVESLAKLVALGFDVNKTRLSFQEYFEKLGENPAKWGKPFSALLGAFAVQDAMRIPAIGGKDSMSGTFKDIDVPPTLISFAVNHGEVDEVISPELKGAGNMLVAYMPPYNKDFTLNLESLKKDFEAINKHMRSGDVLSAKTIGQGGMLTAMTVMAMGNGIGFDVEVGSIDTLSTPWIGGMVLEVKPGSLLSVPHLPVALTREDSLVSIGSEKTTLEALRSDYTKGLETIFPSAETADGEVKSLSFETKKVFTSAIKIAKPKVYIPVFPGTNCEYDMARAFELNGAEAEIQVFRNIGAGNIEESIAAMVKGIESSQMIALPGGFSAGDEPDGSAKFIATAFRNPAVTEAVMKLLKEKDGLMLGICNGFQALVKLGLITHGEIRSLDKHDPTLTYNKIARHVSTISRVKVASNNSPWLTTTPVGAEYNVAVSHGEGRFVAEGDALRRLIENGQIITQYVDLNGDVTMDGQFNPNGSVYGIEGAVSPDGRVFGKMGHTERFGKGLYQNIPGDFDMDIFASGVKYFK